MAATAPLTERPTVAMAAQEPINAHSHLLSMLLGNTLTIPVTEGKLAIGTWQVRAAVWGMLRKRAMQHGLP